MAGGGKETPRQKMIGMMYLVLTALLAMNVTKQVLKGYVTVNESVVKSRKNLDENNKRITEAFQQAIGGNPGAAPYYEKALEVQKLIKATTEHIDKLKGKVMEACEGFPSGGDTTTLKWSLKNGKIDAYDESTHLLIGDEANSPKKGEWSANELRGKLDVLISNIVGIMDKMQTDPKTKLYPADYEALKKKVTSLKPHASGEEEDGIKMDWEAENFYHLPEGAVICNLNKIAADLKSMESEMLGVFSSASGKLAIKFDNIVARVVAPSSYIQAGQPYEASIFLAASSSKLGQGDMEILLGVDSAAAATGAKGELVPLVNGEGAYKAPTSAEGDKEYKGVIKYKNPDGTFKYYPFNGQYKVAKAAASVSADLMNVFYAGVPNPVTAAAAGISPADISVSASGAGVRVAPKGNGKYEMTFSGTGDCNITVSAKTKDGVKAQGPPIKFRVKPLPKPDIKVGGKFAPPEMKKSDLAIVSAIGAGAAGFDFQANYIVQSLEVTGKVKGKLVQGACQGSSLSGDALNIFRGADPNTKIYVDAKIKGPDGKITSTTTGIKVVK
ncbi:MAG: type IX secretion system motor protein PorM/GldM [Bacteroidia bacterium]